MLLHSPVKDIHIHAYHAFSLMIQEYTVPSINQQYAAPAGDFDFDTTCLPEDVGFICTSRSTYF
jgi:hypothetical protein